MRAIFLLLIIATAFTSCKSTSDASKINSGATASSQIYQIMVSFKSEEGMKKALYQLDKLSLEVKEEISASDLLYLLELKAQPYSIDGTVEKIGLLDEVKWAKQVKP